MNCGPTMPSIAHCCSAGSHGRGPNDTGPAAAGTAPPVDRAHGLGAGRSAPESRAGHAAVLSESAWDAEAMLARHGPEVERELGDDDGVLLLEGRDVPQQAPHRLGGTASMAANWASAPTARPE